MTPQLVRDTNLIGWSAPIPVFGDVSKSVVATLGLNPSNLEYVDRTGLELDGERRRFHSLTSLGIRKWSEARESHLQQVSSSCRNYFLNRPYLGWFGRLNEVIKGTESSYFSGGIGACHLDLVPYATSCKWSALSSAQRELLLINSGDTIGLLLRNSPVQLLVLNGASVVKAFQEVAEVTLGSKQMPSWSLPRAKKSVDGYSFKGIVRRVGGIELKRDLYVLGFNHNLQSSFGVTREVMSSIQRWVTVESRSYRLETK
jgi:hypothetical protein